MKTPQQLMQKLKYCDVKLSDYEGHLSEDPDVVYTRGYKDALEWVLEEDENERGDSTDKGESPESS